MSAATEVTRLEQKWKRAQWAQLEAERAHRQGEMTLGQYLKLCGEAADTWVEYMIALDHFADCEVTHVAH